MRDLRGAQKLTRRGFLRLSLAAGGVAVAGGLLAACQQAAPSPTAAPAKPAPTAPPAAKAEPTKPAAQPTAAPGVAKPAARGPVKVGFVVPTSGQYAGLGPDMVNGSKLYFDQVGNKAGGREIQVLVEDETADAQVALQKTRKLIEQDKIDIFTGVVSTAAVYAIRDTLHNSETISIISNAGGNDLTRKRKSPYIFRTSFTSWQVAFPLGEWVAKNLAKKVFITAADYGFGQESAAAFEENFVKNGGTILGKVFPKLGNTDYGPFLPQIAAANPEATYNFYSGSDAVNFVKQYADFGLKQKIKLTGSGFLVEEDVLPEQGRAAEGAISSLFWAYTLDNPENKAFIEAYEKKYNKTPSTFAVQAYDAGRVIVEALNKVEGDTSNKQALIKAIESVKFNSPRGPFEFDPETHQVILNMYVREVRQVGGRFTNVVIANLGQVRDPKE